MSGKISTSFALTVIILIGGFLGVAIWKMGQQSMDVNQVSMKKNGSSIKTQTAQSDGRTDTIVYQNKSLGFSLDLPANWQEYITRPAQGGVKFFVPTKDENYPSVLSVLPPNGGVYADVFVVAIESRASWEARKTSVECRVSVPNCPIDDEGSIGNNILGKNTQYVFYLITSQDMPSDVRWPNEGIDFFRAGFKLLDQSESKVSDWKTYYNDLYGYQIDYPRSSHEGEMIEYTGKDDVSGNGVVALPGQGRDVNFISDDGYIIGILAGGVGSTDCQTGTKVSVDGAMTTICDMGPRGFGANVVRSEKGAQPILIEVSGLTSKEMQLEFFKKILSTFHWKG